jgi:PAS domain S-box-containing protein
MASHQDSLPLAERPVLLVVDEDETLHQFLRDELSAAYDIEFPAGEEDALAILADRPVALVIIADDAENPERSFALRDRLVAAGHAVPMILTTAQGDEETAVAALRRGFMDYIVKRPGTLRSDLLRRRIETSLELARLKRENERLRAAIEESQARLFNIYDSLDDVIMQIDHECRVVSLNRSAAALANAEPKDAVGKVCWSLFNFYPCEQRKLKERCHIYRTFLEGETIRGERESEKTKEVHAYMTFITTLKDQDYVVYRETDITEKRRLERRIADALRSLGANPERRADG